ncbi:hypothetical protein JQ607_09545 [Bradyrhizobium liaoningense]|uniref:hypothetical protein n=1 Tax=Bradyrhizobium liaoningense TaxID=43992 RepID=UPI001BA46D45|nr:hypothetical protein [Bradyrhizobium liaoningense]MBR0840432.1 hypothetical protein [Bradyrhizobium liaoningense]
MGDAIVTTLANGTGKGLDAALVHNPGAGLSADDFIEKIIALRPMIRDQQEAADANGGYVKDVHETLLDWAPNLFSIRSATTATNLICRPSCGQLSKCRGATLARAGATPLLPATFR